MTEEKLNSNLEEIVKYEQAEMTEQALEKIQQDALTYMKTWMTNELKLLKVTVKVDYFLEKLMKDRAFLRHQLEQLKINRDPNEEELRIITESIELRNAQIQQIVDLQQKMLESDQKTSTKLNALRSITDMQVVYIIDTVMQDWKKQCYKYYKLKIIDWFEEKCQNLEAQLEEYKKEEKVSDVFRCCEE